MCYWNISEVKEERLKCNMIGRTKKTSQTIKSKQQTKQRKPNGKRRNFKNKNKKIIMKIKNKMQVL